MLKKLYDKSNMWFAILWIALYCVLMSLGDSISVALGVQKSVTFAVGLSLSILLFLFLRKNDLLDAYGICRAKASARFMLYYIPLIIMLAANLLCGFALRENAWEAALSVCTMLCVGFLEEVIFRGLLFEAMRKDNLRVAVIVSSVTFGVGHIINLINASGTELLPNLFQVVYATAAGFMFVMIYYKTRSLLICIVAHGIFNSLGVFANEANATLLTQIFSAIFLSAVTGSYAAYIAWTIKIKSD